MKPVLIITRPAPDGDRFATEVAAQIDVPVVISPLQRIVPIEVECRAQGFVFTSTNGVAQAERLGLTRGPAWCVGDRTMRDAAAAGFDATSAKGNVEDLIAMILQQSPQMELAHIRGREARGDVAHRLSAAGIMCADVIAYDQRPVDLSQEAKIAIEGANRTIIPLFSPRAAALLVSQAKIGPSAVLIAMSAAVAKPLSAHRVEVLDTPSGRAMLAAVISACRKMSPL
tara:strand:- start:6172 stop:6855 length:684 start_codon:yes stop_codon:yes gene_type:complete